jgi:hypothetical protein
MSPGETFLRRFASWNGKYFNPRAPKRFADLKPAR